MSQEKVLWINESHTNSVILMTRCTKEPCVVGRSKDSRYKQTNMVHCKIPTDVRYSAQTSQAAICSPEAVPKVAKKFKTQ